MLNKSTLSFFVLLAIAFISCNKVAQVDAPNPSTPVNKIAPDGFNFITTKEITVNITALTNRNKPINGVPVSVYSTKGGKLGDLLFKGITNAQGQISTKANLPSYMDTVVVDANFVGLLQNVLVTVSSTSLNCTIGGSMGYAGDVVGILSGNESKATLAANLIRSASSSNGGMVSMDINGVKTDTKFSYLGAYESSGKPKYLETPGDEISLDMLNSLNASLPEQSKVPVKNPEYIAKDATSNINITEDAEVWLTFVHEGAGYRNALGFYTYESNTPPKTLADIKEIKFVFPNASLRLSSGDMMSGDKVKLGTFKAGTTIGLVLFQNAWNGKDVTLSATALFSDANLNPEKDAELRRHNVLLQYKDYFMIGFEDIRRDESGCDQDFNDLLVYATSNPITAIDKQGVQEAETPVDTDGDGVIDIKDLFPKDPERAYINYYPSQNNWGTLAFEDMFPSAGDYDMNDLVISYRYTMIANAQNNIVEMTAEYQPLANGAAFQNAFGVQFPFSPSLIRSATGQKVSTGLAKLSSNGTEAGQSKAVIIPIDNVSAVLNYPNGAFFVNTRNDLDKVTVAPIAVSIQFNSPITPSTLNIANSNPFLISNQRRTHEVHLPGFAPTDLADLKLLGTGDDDSKPSSNRYYVSKDNHPWALNFAETLKYPLEGVAINKAYLYFLDWAKSGGSSYKDWYSNTSSAYRVSDQLYNK
jgi:LruC domain-containing protein